MPATVLDTGDTAMKRTDTFSAFRKLPCYLGRQKINRVTKKTLS